MNRKEQIKNHFRENKKVYIVGGACLATGVVIGVALCPKQIAMNIGKDNEIVQEILMVRRGHPGYFVRNVTTGETYASQNRAAQALGVKASQISAHLRGLKPDVNGEVLERICEAS